MDGKECHGRMCGKECHEKMDASQFQDYIKTVIGMEIIGQDELSNEDLVAFIVNTTENQDILSKYLEYLIPNTKFSNILLCNTIQYIVDSPEPRFQVLDILASCKSKSLKELVHAHRFRLLDMAIKHFKHPLMNKNIDLYEHQPWKGKRLFEWFCHESNYVDDRMVSPILVMLDDYEIQYKIKGVKLVDWFSRNTTPHHLRKSGIGNLFKKSLVKCLTYVDEYSLMEEAFNAYFGICQVLYPSHSPEYEREFQEMLNEILKLFVFTHGKPSIKILLNGAKRVVRTLGMNNSFCKPLIGACLDALCYPISVQDSCQLLLVLVEECWPLMIDQTPAILVGVAEQYLNEALPELKSVLEMLKIFNGPYFKKDVELLCEMDANFEFLRE